MARKGQTVSDETRQKMREAAIRQWEERRAVGTYSRRDRQQQKPDSKVCRECERRLPIRLFAPTGHYVASLGRKSGDHTCRECRAKQRRAKGIPERHQRYDARGRVWCTNCKQYLEADHFKRHPQRPHTFWSYCKDCTRVLDRLRWTGDRQRRHNESRTRRQKQRTSLELRERRDFVADAIRLLGRRGFTLTDVSKLAGVSLTSVYEWRDKARRVTPNAAERFAVVLRATAHLPNGDQPAYRRRRPHPELEGLIARLGPELARYPLRSRWGSAA